MTSRVKFYSPDKLEEREWVTPDEFIALDGPYQGWRFRMLYDGNIILISKNGESDAEAD